MICRARPKFIKKDYEEFLLSSTSYFSGNDDGTYYYNRGSNALQHFLMVFNTYYNKKARVAVQSFTCHSVLDAIINSGSIALLYDVSKDDCSLDYKLVDFSVPIDIIILTHYQGIPNKNYIEFSETCKRKGILLIDDLAHGATSTIKTVELGALSNIYIESYAWDKPYTALTGGSLTINKLSKDFITFYTKAYYMLSVEDDITAVADIKMIYFTMKYTDPVNYYNDFDYTIFHNMPVLVCFYNNYIFNIKAYRYILSLIYRIYNKIKQLTYKNTIKRMARIKAAFINMQRLCDTRDALIKFSIPDLYKNAYFEFVNTDTSVVWNRFSVVATDKALLDYFKNIGVDVRNFNWPTCLHDLIENNHVNCFYMTSFHASEYLSKNILNIPIWQEMKDC